MAEGENIVVNPPSAPSSGKGGQVVLIFVVLMTGYLYVTGKLQVVAAAVRGQSNTVGMTSPSLSLPPPLPNPSLGAGQYPARFTLAFDPRYHAGPVQIEAADVSTCRQLVYNTAYQVTGSMSLATQYANQFCP